MTPDTPSDPPLLTLPSGLGFTDEGPRGAPVLLLLHGLPGSHRDFRWLAAAMPGVRILRVDFPGFGGSPASPHTLDERGRAALLPELLDAVGVDRVLVVGHSVGGAVASAFAAGWPARVVGVALLASAGARPHLGFRLMPFRTLTGWLDRPSLRDLTLAFVRRLYIFAGFPKRLPLSDIEHTTRAAALVRFEAHGERVAALQVPTLVAWAEDDPIVQASIMAAMADRAPPGPRLHFRTGGHNVQKTQAVEIGAALTQLARATVPAGATAAVIE